MSTVAARDFERAVAEWASVKLWALVKLSKLCGFFPKSKEEADINRAALGDGLAAHGRMRH